MIKGNRIAEGRYLDPSRSKDPNHLRGQFVPWARLRIPETPGAFKFARGTLLVCTRRTVLLYDIKKARLQQKIEVDANRLRQIRNVNLSEYHIIIALGTQLNVYDRETGSLSLSIPAGWSWDFYASRENQWRCTKHTFDSGELSFQRAARPNRSDRGDSFQAGG